MARGTLRAVVDRHFPLEDAPEALAALDNPERVGKILLDVAA
jgi:NADPH:quinone reductase-like Zn-dependent oxidoreductase